MRKTILSLTLISFTVLFFSSCKKEKNEQDSSSYISFKLDGKQKTFTAKAVALKAHISDFNTIGFSAYQDTSSTERMYLQIIQKPDADITARTYIDPGPDSEDLVVLGAYLPDSRISNKAYSAGLQEDDSTPRFQITIASINDKTITGTFTGTFHEGDSDGPAAPSAITDGKFSLQLLSN